MGNLGGEFGEYQYAWAESQAEIASELGMARAITWPGPCAIQLNQRPSRKEDWRDSGNPIDRNAIPRPPERIELAHPEVHWQNGSSGTYQDFHQIDHKTTSITESNSTFSISYLETDKNPDLLTGTGAIQAKSTSGLAPYVEQRDLSDSLTGRRSVVVVDATLMNNIPKQELASSRVIAIDVNRDAIDQISIALAELSEIDVMRVISHGSNGNLWFGEQQINWTTLTTRTDEIAAWGNALAIDADILLYGCSVAETDEGRQFVRTLADLTKSDIAASSNLTGFSGDVILEFQVGDLTHSPEATTENYAEVGITLCTRVLWNDLKIGDQSVVLSGRSQDWFKAAGPKDPSNPKLLVMPRGLRKSGAKDLNELVVTENPVRWRSRYGSLVVANENRVVMEGMNEKGLAAHALAQPDTEYGVRDLSRQGIQMGLVVPYILDNASTVAEALALLKQIQPVAINLDGFPIGVSFVIEDRLGNSAVVEYVKSGPEVDPSEDPGVVKTFQGQDVRVFANLDYESSLATLQKDYAFDVTKDTRNTAVPGNGGRIFRFVRASFFSNFLREMKPKTLGEAKAALMSVMRNVSNPIGAPGDFPGKGEFSGDETNWRTLSDLTNRVFTFDNARTLATFDTDLKKLNFAKKAGIRALDPGNSKLNGDVTRNYRLHRSKVPGLEQ